MSRRTSVLGIHANLPPTGYRYFTDRYLLPEQLGSDTSLRKRSNKNNFFNSRVTSLAPSKVMAHTDRDALHDAGLCTTPNWPISNQAVSRMMSASPSRFHSLSPSRVASQAPSQFQSRFCSMRPSRIQSQR